MRTKYLILFLLFAGLMYGQEGHLSKANNLLKSEKYGESIPLYQGLLDTGNDSYELFYNAGLAYLNVDSLGLAILNMEKALELQPNNSDLQRNLRVANGRIENQVSTIPDFFLSRYWRGLAGYLPSAVWSWLHILALILAVYGLAQWLLKTDLKSKKRGFTIMGISLGVSLIFFLLGNTRRHAIAGNDYAIVMSKNLTIKSGPDERSDDQTEISQGVKIKILDKIGEWSKVQLMDKEQGWVKTEVFERI